MISSSKLFLLPILKKTALVGCISSLLLVLKYIFPIVYAQVLKLIIDSIVVRDNDQLPRLMLWFIIVAIVHLIVGAFAKYTGVVYSQSFLQRMRSKYGTKLRKASLADLQTQSTGEIIAVYNTALVGLCEFVTQQVPMLLAIVLSFTSGIGYIFQMHWLLAASCSLPSVASLFFVNWKSKQLAKEKEAYLTTLADESSSITDSVNGLVEIVTNNVQDNYLSSFETISARKSKQFYLVEKLDNQILAFSVGQHNLTMILVLAVGGMLYFHGLIPIGDVLAAFSMFYLLSNPIRNITRYIAQWRSGIVNYKRVDKIMSLPNERTSGITSFNTKACPIIDVQLERFTYGDGKFELPSCEYDITLGSRIAIVGKSGCGKSTLVKLLAGYSDLYSGSIRIMDVEVKEAQPQALREHVLYVNDDYELFAKTVYGNFNMMQGAQDFLSTALEIAELSPLIKQHGGVDSFLSIELQENATNLSGGERQRLILALALQRDADIFIFDEMFSAIGSDQRNRIINNLNVNYPDKTLIFITHQLDFLPWMDKVMFMSDEGVISMGSHIHLLEDSTDYKNFVLSKTNETLLVG